MADPHMPTSMPPLPPAASNDNEHLLKREPEMHEDSVEHPSKRTKFMNGERGGHHGRHSQRVGPHHNGHPGRHKDPLSQLQRGLNFLVSSQGFSEEVATHARELQRLLFDRDSALPIQSTDHSMDTSLISEAQQAELPSQEEAESTRNPHTDVPPPFPVASPDKFAKGKSMALESLNKAAPTTMAFMPVPTIANYPVTSLVPAPNSTSLPQAPQITEISLVNAPFMHTSALPAYVSPTGTNSYEHLEFLGDAYLEVIATRLIHARFPLHSVGQKSGLRELLVKNETLAEFTKAYGWGERIQCSHTDRHGPTWTKILGDVFEAYLACVVIQGSSDAGFLTAERWLTELWAPKILQWRANGDGLHDSTKKGDQPLDAKTDLNRLLVGKEAKLEYREEKPMQLIKEGNRTVFFMGVYLTGWGFSNQHLGSGEGRSKQAAGTLAAEEALRNSQDIIQLAYQRKLAHEKTYKKNNALNKAFNSRGKGSRPPAYGHYGGLPNYGQGPPPPGHSLHLPQSGWH